MISKLKYISIIVLSVGGLFKLQHISIGWLTGGVSLTIGVLLLIIYCIAKIIEK
jgi:uncharacterized membrane protein AbrB (regulator of aidB expression)